MAFRFKQFTVKDDKSTMKVGTDSVLLGTWVSLNNPCSILDIGTGCGIISLILAQRCNATIDAIDISRDSVVQAKENFDRSKWGKRLSSYKITLNDFAGNANKKYDIIITNPPYFQNSLKPKTGIREIARHNTTLGPNDLIAAVRKLLNNDGTFSLIYPVEEGMKFITLARNNELYCRRLCYVVQREGKSANRLLMELTPQESDIIEEKLVIKDNDNEFTRDYKNITGEFYLGF